MEVNAKLFNTVRLGLHWAAYEGQLDTAKLLLQRGARVEAKDNSFGGTPLDWALYAWGNSTERKRAERSYYEVVALLVRAGARLDAQWYEGDEERRRTAGRMRSDSRMLAALRCQMPG